MSRSKRKRKNKSRCRLSFGTLIRCEWEQIDRRAMLIGGVVLLVLALLCLLAVGSPIYARHLLRLPGCMPPSWCLFLLGALTFFLLGALIGALCAAPSSAILRARFRGLMLLVPAALFRLFWYPLFFGAITPALALISLCIAVFLTVLALFALVSVFRLACPVIFIQLLWLGWLICANFFVLWLN